MERKLLTLLVLSAFGMNVSAYSFRDALNALSTRSINTVRNAQQAVLDGAQQAQGYFGPLSKRVAEKAWSEAKYCGTKAKNAALWASRKVVNTTLGGKMNSLSTDLTTLTTGLTSLTAGLDKTQKMNSVKQLGSNVRDSIKQLSSNAWTNKKASAKIAAATVATVVGVYYADKLVKSASKWLSGKRKAAANAN